MGNRRYHVAVVGATGAVGRKILEILEQRFFPVGRLKLLASFRSAGTFLPFRGEEVKVENLTESSFKGVDIALFSAGSIVSKKFSPLAVEAGAVVIDNSSTFRMDKEVPLIIPEVNPELIVNKPGIISNPNCSTIQMVVALKPIHDNYHIKRVVVSTYQSVSGSGQKAIDELKSQVKSWVDNGSIVNKVYPHQIAFNCLPHIDLFLENGYTKEEMKMVNETRKILGDETIQVCPTTVRVPIFYSHSEALNVETVKHVKAANVKRLLATAPGIEVVDDPGENYYPIPINATNKDLVYVGRIRDDISLPNAVNFWVVSDNLRKGAALNAVQIAELLLKKL